MCAHIEYATKCTSKIDVFRMFNPHSLRLQPNQNSQTQTLSRQNGTLSMSNWIISCYLSVCSLLFSCSKYSFLFFFCWPIYVQFIGIKMTVHNSGAIDASTVSISVFSFNIQRFNTVRFGVYVREVKKKNYSSNESLMNHISFELTIQNGQFYKE